MEDDLQFQLETEVHQFNIAKEEWKQELFKTQEKIDQNKNDLAIQKKDLAEDYKPYQQYLKAEMQLT